MKTERIDGDIDKAVKILKAGGLVAVPTETVYGLAGNGLDEEAVKKIYEVKGRPERKALSLMVHGADAMARWCVDVPRGAYALAERYWPGPLTIILKSGADIPELVRAGGSTVGLRCPDQAKTRELLEKTALPLAAPSANPSGAPSPKTAEAVLAYFDGRIDAVIDGGPCGIGTESTIIDMSQTPYRILREAALTQEEVFSALRASLAVIGITGGSGCGKTTVLHVLEKFGACVIDCDEVYHELTMTSGQLRDELCRRFGDVYTGSVLDRKKLGAIVFRDKAALSELNAITHKYVDLEIERRLRVHAVNGGRLAAVDAIALLGNRYAQTSIFNVAVTAPHAARVQRLMQREGISEEYAKLRIAAQKDNEYFARGCDYVLHNDSDIASFEMKCEKFFMEVLDNVR